MAHIPRMPRVPRMGGRRHQQKPLLDQQSPRQVGQSRFPRPPALQTSRTGRRRRLQGVVDQPQQVPANAAERARQRRVDARSLEPREQRPGEAGLIESGEEVGEPDRAAAVGAEQHAAQLVQHRHPVDHEVAVEVAKPLDPFRQVEGGAVRRRTAGRRRAFQVDMAGARPIAGRQVAKRPDLGRPRQHRLDVDLEDASNVVEGDRGQGNSVVATRINAGHRRRTVTAATSLRLRSPRAGLRRRR